jgi:tetratricopeptide (TPR) repeat protein
VTLTGFKHEYQLFNNCGPASLSINLSYWGWAGEQRQAATVLKPVQDDKNVSPRELYEYALTQGYDAYIRSNGDVDTLKRFIAAGYPVLVEKGFTCLPGERCSDWFGHYSVFMGYDDAQEKFILQDSFRGPNITMSYDDVMRDWRAFNYLYVVFFPLGPEHDAKVRALLGEAADLDANYRAALRRAQQEAAGSTGEAASFAWFNVGTNLYYLQDYAGAAAAFDQSRQIGLPYRMLWYQFGPYTSYYYLSRYQDVIELTSFAIDSVNTVPGLEEAYYWRGLAYRAIGESTLAAEDFRTALQRHPNYELAAVALQEMGLTP